MCDSRKYPYPTTGGIKPPALWKFQNALLLQLTGFIFSGDEIILIPVEDKNIKVHDVLPPTILKFAFTE